jgi:hypothetical protein
MDKNFIKKFYFWAIFASIGFDHVENNSPRPGGGMKGRGRIGSEEKSPYGGIKL